MSEVLVDVTTFLLVICAFSLIAGAGAVVFFLLLKSQFGRAKALAVTEKAEARAGIPFYVKRGRLIQETSYLETLATCTLTAKKVAHDAEGKPGQVEIEYANAKTISLSPENTACLVTIRAKLAEVQRAGEPGSHWDAMKANFDAMAAYTGQLPAYPLPLEGNVIRESAFVDYDTPFYLNKVQPLSGDAELTLELAADGTLIKATTKGSDKTFEQALSLLPTGKLLEQVKAAVPTAAPQPTKTTEAAAVAAAGIRYEFNLAVEPWHIRHIRYTEVADRNFRPGLALASECYWYRREVVSDLSSAGKTTEAAPTAPDKPKQG